MTNISLKLSGLNTFFSFKIYFIFMCESASVNGVVFFFFVCVSVAFGTLLCCGCWEFSKIQKVGIVPIIP